MSLKSMLRVMGSNEYSNGDRLFLIAFADVADDDGEGYPKIETVAGKAGMSLRNAQLIKQKLIEQGTLIVLANAQGGRRSTRMRINWDNLPQAPSDADGKRVLPEKSQRKKPTQPATTSASEVINRGENITPLNEPVDTQIFHPRGENSYTPGVKIPTHEQSLNSQLNKSSSTLSNQPHLQPVDNFTDDDDKNLKEDDLMATNLENLADKLDTIYDEKTIVEAISIVVARGAPQPLAKLVLAAICKKAKEQPMNLVRYITTCGNVSQYIQTAMGCQAKIDTREHAQLLKRLKRQYKPQDLECDHGIIDGRLPTTLGQAKCPLCRRENIDPININEH